MKPGASLACRCGAAAKQQRRRASGLAGADSEGGAAGLTEREAIADRDGSPARPGVGEGRGWMGDALTTDNATPPTHSGHERGLPGTTTTPTTRRRITPDQSG
jgi:hypothetical protein